MEMFNCEVTLEYNARLSCQKLNHFCLFQKQDKFIQTLGDDGYANLRIPDYIRPDAWVKKVRNPAFALKI